MRGRAIEIQLNHGHYPTALQMFDCKEDFRLADEEREEGVKRSTDRVRMAADEEELETSFTRVIELLDEVRSALPQEA